MNLESLGNLGEFLGGVAVIASLIYLAVQIRQNTSWIRLQVEQGLKRDQWELRRVVVENREVGELLAKSIAEFDELRPDERIRINMACASVMDHLQQLYFLRNQGLAWWETMEKGLASYLALPSFRHWWPEGRDVLHPEFVEYVERDVLPAYEQAPTHWQR
jgi:hypothetical protein